MQIALHPALHNGGLIEASSEPGGNYINREITGQ